MRTKKKRLIDALMPHIRQGILAATLLQPDKSWYAADLARRLGTTRSSLQREVQALIDVGILKHRQEGRTVYFQADRDCPVFLELRGLMTKTVGLVDLLASALQPFAKQIQVAFVFGSIARVEEMSVSDIDLFIIGDVRLQDIASTLGDTQEKAGREINPVIYTQREFKRRLAAKENFVLNVLEKPKLFVIGIQRDLDEISKSKSGNS